MLSLFTPFDLYYSSNCFTLFFIFICFFFCSLFKFSSVSAFLSLIFDFLEGFFSSLKAKNFPKLTIFFLCSIFFTVLIINFLSVLPFNFALTSQLGLILYLSLSMWFSFMLFSMLNNSKGQISHFIPKGTPLILVPFLFVIEVVSSLIRPLTLTVRLVANILAGHLLMILLFSLVFAMNYVVMAYFLLNVVEMFVALIQSYIFSTMICLYFSEME